MSQRLRHVVLFYFEDHATEAQKQAVGEGLGRLPALIPEILRYEYGPSAGIGEGSADAMLVSEFDDEEAWRTYQAHPEHRRVIEQTISPVTRRLERCQTWVGDGPT